MNNSSSKFFRNNIFSYYSLVQPCSSPLLLPHSAAAAVQKPTSSVSTAVASSTDTVTSTVVTSTAIFATSTTTTVVASSSSNAASTLAGRPAAPLYLGNISNIHHHVATKQHIEVLEKMALDGTFGQLAQQVPARLANVYNTIGALLKVADAQEQQQQHQQQQQQQQQLQKQHFSPPRPNSRDPLRSSHLDSGDEDENVLRSCIVPSGMRKVVGHKGAIKASMNVAPHSRRHDEPRVRNNGFETIMVKKALWEEFGNKKISIDVRKIYEQTMTQ